MFSSTMDQNFSKNFLISCGLHVALLTLAFLGGKVISSVFKNNDVEIIRSSVRVDIVGMPKFSVQELKELQKAAPLPTETKTAEGVKEETKTETEDVVKKDDLVIEEVGKKKTSSFMNIVSSYSAKKVAPKEKNKGSKTGTHNKNLEALIVEGNRLSQGTALVGDFADGPDSPFGSYVQTIPGVIQPHWKLPSYLLDKDLRCRIKIYLSTTGQLLKLEVIESSGQAEFDARAEKAIRDASPFPQPSREVGARLTNSGIILGFPL